MKEDFVMKKLISVLLSILMVFSVFTVTFVSAEDEQEPVSVSENAEEEFNYEEIPLWAVKLALKLVKIFAKIAMVFAKLGIKSGAIDINDIIGKLGDLVNKGETPVTTTEAAEAA